MTDNKGTIKKAFKEFEKQILLETESRLKSWCYDLMSAAYKNRLGNPRSHEFTGNLLNSIMVGLYRRRTPIFLCAVGDRGVVRAPIMGKMRVRQSQLGYSAKMYRFKKDWEGVTSAYVPTVDTNGGNGLKDAIQFFHSYRPDGNNMFDLVVAYPVEYATWVERERQSTGYLQTFRDAKTTGITFMELKSA